MEEPDGSCIKIGLDEWGAVSSPDTVWTDGLCGFTNPEESEYDLFHTGHAGTSVSLGLGLAGHVIMSSRTRTRTRTRAWGWPAMGWLARHPGPWYPGSPKGLGPGPGPWFP